MAFPQFHQSARGGRAFLRRWILPAVASRRRTLRHSHSHELDCCGVSAHCSFCLLCSFVRTPPVVDATGLQMRCPDSRSLTGSPAPAVVPSFFVLLSSFPAQNAAGLRRAVSHHRPRIAIHLPPDVLAGLMFAGRHLLV
eukprot:2909828-Prymnesium_polylepis.2